MTAITGASDLARNTHRLIPVASSEFPKGRPPTKKIPVTGSAGFIGYHVCDLLLQQGHEVVGYDGMTDYYAVSLKERRLEMLAEHA